MYKYGSNFAHFSFLFKIIQFIKCIKQCRQSVFLDSSESQMQLTNPNNASRPANFGSTGRSRLTESTVQTLAAENDHIPSAPLLSAQNSFEQIQRNYAFQASNTPQMNREFSTFSVSESLPPTYSQTAHHSRSPTPPPTYSALFD